MSDPKHAIVDFRLITAYDALKNIVEICGKRNVQQALDELPDDADWPVSMFPKPTQPPQGYVSSTGKTFRE